MKYFLSAKVIETAKVIDLISIGIVSEDGREFYGVNENCDLSWADDWVKNNIVPHLPAKPVDWLDDTPWKSVNWMRVELAGYFRLGKVLRKDYVDDGNPKGIIAPHWTYEAHPDDIPEFWANCAPYTWVAFCQILGGLMDLPIGFPKYPFDIMQLRAYLGYEGVNVPAREGSEHHALEDARHVKKLYEFYTGNIN